MPPLRPAALLASILALAGCESPSGYPSLAPRPVEKLATSDENAAQAPALPSRPVDPAVAAEVNGLVARAEAGRAAFEKELATARTAVQAPGARTVGSEAWIAAQQAVTRADAARGEVGAALADLDALRVAGAQQGADSAAVAEAWDRVSRMAADQDSAYQALAGALPSE